VSTSTHGFDETQHLTVLWQWIPVPPRPTNARLPRVAFRDDPAFLAVRPDERAWAPFRFSFPQLAKLTPDLRFYRLIQSFNTPLLSMSTREAGHSAFAYWGGAFPAFRDEFRWAHYWWFEDRTDGDTVALEYAFDGGLCLYAETKPKSDLAARHAAIVAQMRRADAASTP
jgi:hypothetical protein